jgi:hypothetical protein
MMHKLSYTLLLSVGCIYAADTDHMAGTVASPSAGFGIAEVPAQVVNTMISRGVADTPESALDSSLGQIYEMINNAPLGINSVLLWGDFSVSGKAEEYKTSIMAGRKIQRLAAKVTALVQSNAPVEERAVVLGAFGLVYSLAQEKITEAAIPGIQFPVIGTVSNMIQSNTQLKLNAEQRDLYKAGQLSMAMNMNMQAELDITAFNATWHNYLAVVNDSHVVTVSGHRAASARSCLLL